MKKLKITTDPVSVEDSMIEKHKNFDELLALYEKKTMNHSKLKWIYLFSTIGILLILVCCFFSVKYFGIMEKQVSDTTENQKVSHNTPEITYGFLKCDTCYVHREQALDSSTLHDTSNLLSIHDPYSYSSDSISVNLKEQNHLPASLYLQSISNKKAFSQKTTLSYNKSTDVDRPFISKNTIKGLHTHTKQPTLNTISVNHADHVAPIDSLSGTSFLNHVGINNRRLHVIVPTYDDNDLFKGEFLMNIRPPFYSNNLTDSTLVLNFTTKDSLIPQKHLDIDSLTGKQTYVTPHCYFLSQIGYSMLLYRIKDSGHSLKAPKHIKLIRGLCFGKVFRQNWIGEIGIYNAEYTYAVELVPEGGEKTRIYDYDNEKNLGSGMYDETVAGAFFVPVRIKKQFLCFNNRIAITPGIGINVNFINRLPQPYNEDNNYFITNATADKDNFDYIFAKGNPVNNNWFFLFETSGRIEYRLKNNFGISIDLNYNAGFQKVFQTEIVYKLKNMDEHTGMIYTRGSNVNAQLNLKIPINKRKK